MNSAAIMAVTSHKSEKQMLQSYRGARHHQWCDSDPNIKSQASRELYRYKKFLHVTGKIRRLPASTIEAYRGRVVSAWPSQTYLFL
jgi:hypothetical protein